MKEDEFRKRDTRQPTQSGAWWVNIGGEWTKFYDGPLAMQEARRLNAVMVYGDDQPPNGFCIKTRKSWQMPDRALCLLVLMIAAWGLACILGTAHAFLGVVLLEVIVISAWLASRPSET